MSLRDKQIGFTIIELLVVVAIIGLLATLVLMRFQGVQARARDTRRVVDVGSLAQALHLYNNRVGKYPFSYANLVIDGTDAVSGVFRDEGIIRASILDPTNSGNFVYSYSSIDGETFEIKYYLETEDIYGKNQGVNYLRP